MKKNNNYLVADLMLAAALVLMFCDKVNKWIVFGIVLAAAIPIAIGFCSPVKVRNNSRNTIKAKPEDGSCDPVDVKPGEDYYGADGVKVGDRVYKTVDGSHVIVTKNGKVVTKSAIGSIMNTMRGGWLDKCPDDCWKPLFNS